MKKRILCIVFFTIVLAKTVFAFDINGYQTKITELNGLVSQCEQKGLNCPYEKMYISVMEQFIKNTDFADEVYVSNSLDKIYADTKLTLESFIAETKKPLQSPKYLTSPITVQGRSMIANTTQGQRPVFFTGYGHFDSAVNSLDSFSKIGANITQQEIGPWDVIFEAKKPYGWEIHDNDKPTYTFETNYDKNYVRGGVVSMKLSFQSATQSGRYAYITQKYSVKPNTSYTYSLAVKSSVGGSAYFTPFAGADRKYLDASAVWKTYKGTFTTDASATKSSFIIMTEGECDVYVDNIIVREMDSTLNLLENGNFEKNANTFGNNKEYVVVPDVIENRIVPMLQKAAENNVAVSLLISPHYFPTFVKSYYPDINIYHEQYALIIDKYIETLAPYINSCTALNDICISNEPASNSSLIPSLATDFQRWIAEKYKTIEAVNAAYKTGYSDFTQVSMQTTVSETRAFYDWMCYNNEKYASWHKRIADKIKVLIPTIKIHSKIQDYFAQNGASEFERNRMQIGIEAENFVQFSDLMGNDSHAYYQSPSRPIQGKLKWYDYLSSRKEAPVFNSEDHIIRDQSTNYWDIVPKFVSADIFQGALHGRTASTIWSWERTTDVNSLFYGNILQRPDSLAAVAKASLDLNRLAYEVTAFQNQQSKVAILYSNLEQVYNQYYIEAMDKTYDACLYGGQKATFVTESDIDTLSQYSVIILPYVTHGNNKLIAALQNAHNLGKTVILITDECLTKDENGNDISPNKTGFRVFPSDKVKGRLTFNEIDLSEVIMQIAGDGIAVCNQSGNLVSGLEWRAMDYNGKKLINICNYNSSDLSGLQVLNNGRAIAVKDLISQQAYDNGLNAAVFTPLILEIQSTNNTNIKVAEFRDGKLYVSAQNPDKEEHITKIVATCYDDKGTKLQAGSVKGILKQGENTNTYFTFSQTKNVKIVVELFDGQGILLNSWVTSV